MYSDFASVYDQVMQNVDYVSWAQFYNELMSRYGLQNGRICECACGTGNLTLRLHDLGYQITGSDLSSEMIMAAAQKARASGREVLFICQDMREMRLHRPQDAVLCTNDGLNYLRGEEDLTRFFQAAWRSLRPGGLLLFDLSTPYKIREVLGDHFIGDETADVSYLWQNRYNVAHDYVDMSLAIFIRKHDEEYHRILETQRQYAHSRERLERLLSQCGYTDIQVYSDKRMQAPTPKDTRWFVTAQKPAETLETYPPVFGGKEEL